MKTEYKYLKRWTLPQYYVGAQWDDYFSAGVGQSRDSKPDERANFDAMLKVVGGEKSLSLVRVVRENHWAVGWLEWIAIHQSQTDTLEIANRIMEKFADYPCIDENLLSQYEQEEANKIWRDCYRVKERVEYIRKHRSEFEFHNFSDLLGCVRGNYFAGYASELCYR